MIYKPFQDLSLSALGLGCMRLPTGSGGEGDIDEQETARLVAYAMEQGINYYDTAWGYHNGQSELVMGRVLGAYPRESFYLADKFPGYDLSNMPKVEEIFNQQLEKCQVEYFDFYLFHNVCELNIDAYLDPKYGILDYLLKQKEAGRIRHLGFSAHGRLDVIKRFLAVYGRSMEFCQLQVNYVDWDFQDAKDKVALLNAWGIPVWVMEPMRGGRLAKLAEEDVRTLKALRPEEPIPAWAFRFLQGAAGMPLTLSGMSTFQQLRDNIETYREERPLNARERKTLLDIAAHMTAGVPCTACRYCTSHCKQGLDIPLLLELYNEHSFTNGGFLAPFTLQAMPEDKRPSACLGCKSCEEVCPQQIKISEILEDFNEKLKT